VKKKDKAKFGDYRDFILAEYKKGNIVHTGFKSNTIVVNLEEFLKQPAEDILYDLAHLPEVVLTQIDNPKWINDFAVSVVIRELKRRLDAALEAK